MATDEIRVQVLLDRSLLKKPGFLEKLLKQVREAGLDFDADQASMRVLAILNGRGSPDSIERIRAIEGVSDVVFEQRRRAL